MTGCRRLLQISVEWAGSAPACLSCAVGIAACGLVRSSRRIAGDERRNPRILAAFLTACGKIVVDRLFSGVTPAVQALNDKVHWTRMWEAAIF